MKRIIIALLSLITMAAAAAQNSKLPQNVQLKTVEGKTVESSIIQNNGKPVIVSFWSTTCKPCIRELNTIKEVYTEWQESTGVKLVAISIDDSRNAPRVKPFVDGSEWEYEVYIDQNQALKRAMNVVNIPHTFILNGEGEIVWQHTSFVEGSEEELIELVKKVAAGEEI